MTYVVREQMKITYWVKLLVVILLKVLVMFRGRWPSKRWIPGGKQENSSVGAA